MNKYLSSAMIISLTIITTIICRAETKNVTQQSIPDEYKVKEGQLAFKAAKGAVKIIKSALGSFCELTEYIDAETNFTDDLIDIHFGRLKKTPQEIKYSIEITLERIKKIGNTGWTFQNIGFTNRMILIEGTLIRQQAEIKRLEYELHKAKKSDEKIIEKAKKEASANKKELDEFLARRTWSD